MYRVGVDLGGTNIAVGVINDKYEIIGRGKKKTNMPRPAEAIMADIVEAIRMACADAGISTDEISSVGIGTPGTVNKETGVIEYANNLAFDKVPAVAMLKAMLDVPYYLENDANAAALGEQGETRKGRAAAEAESTGENHRRDVERQRAGAPPVRGAPENAAADAGEIRR